MRVAMVEAAPPLPNLRGAAADENAQRREALLNDIFVVLDQRRRGFISRVELAHILDAMQADPSVTFAVPDNLKPSGNARDSRVTLADLRKALSGLTVADLEDVKWFSESVIKVENELREVWRAAVRKWRGHVECLYKRNLHRYLLTSQPERVSRWLLLRTSMEEVSHDESSIGLLGLGISQQEVEVLFTDETADDINRCSDKIEPFLSALQLRDQLAECCAEADAEQQCPPDLDARIAELLHQLAALAESARELSCLLIHEDTLSYVTAIIRSGPFSQSVVSEGSKVIMALMHYRVQENARDYEKLCRNRVAEYLEIDFDSEGFNLEADQRSHCFDVSKPFWARVLSGPRQTIAEWVSSLLTLRVDFDRGEMLDVLIKYDERRLLLVEDGGERSDDNAPVAVSLFSFGRTVPYLLGRLDVSSHHSMHEHRTPMRTHLWKLLLNVLSSAGERGRRLFRAGDGMRVVCNVVRGNAWGAEREEVSREEEQDRQEEEELYRAGQGTWSLRDPYNSWPYAEYFEHPEIEHRYYTMDFLDDKFYGSKDRQLAAAFLEYMSSDTMWGEAALVEEMMQYPNTLQVFCRVQPPSCFLIRLLLVSPAFPAYIQDSAAKIAAASANSTLKVTCDPDATAHSLFPVCYDRDSGSRREALESFRREITAVEKKNVVLRILAHAYHSLQAGMQANLSLREAGTVRPSAGAQETVDEAPQLEDEITECCKLLARQLPLTLEEVGAVSVAIYLQVKEFTRKSLLAVNQLPPVNMDERQKAGGLEVAKAVPPRPMYFGHYQQLLYNQSNPTQPASRTPMFEYQARLKCLQGTADILFTGENRYLKEPSLFPYEFLVVLRMVQLIRLREASVPPFIAELQDLLEQLTGQRASSIFADSREDNDFAGAEYPWRTGLAQLNTFRVSQVPLRRSQLQRFPRRCPMDVLNGLATILRDYESLNLWEGDANDTRAMLDVAQLEALAARRSVYLALVFNHLCYFNPKVVTLEDSPQGMSLRLGLSLDTISAVADLLGSVPILATAEGLAGCADLTRAVLPEGCRAFRGSPDGSVVVLQVSVHDPAGAGHESVKLAFVCMRSIWMLWANCTKDSAQVLTECSSVRQYFAFDTASGRAA